MYRMLQLSLRFSLKVTNAVAMACNNISSTKLFLILWLASYTVFSFLYSKDTRVNIQR